MVIGSVVALALAASAPVLVREDEQRAYTDALDEQAKRAEAQFGGEPCPTTTAEHVSREDVRIGDHPDMAAAREKVRVSGCGRSAIENINVARFGGAPPWKMTFGLPGAPIAEMRLQQGALPRVLSLLSSAGLPQGCTTVRLRDIYVTARPGHVAFTNVGGGAPPKQARFAISVPTDMLSDWAHLNPGAAWAEVWPFAICGLDRTVVVVFVPLKDRDESRFLVAPIWQQIEEHGGGATPDPDPEPVNVR